MTFNDFLNKWNGQACDYDGAYGNQCVDLYRMYVKEVVGCPQSPGVTGAYQIWDTVDTKYWDKITNTPSGVPQEGDVIIWDQTVGKYGHVAISTPRSTVDKIDSFDQNWPVGSLCHTQSHNYKGVIGWLRPKNKVTEPPKPPVDQCQDVKNQLNECNKCKNDVTSQLSETQKQLETYKVAGQELKKQCDELQKQLSAKDGELNTCRKLFQECDTALGKCKLDLQMEKTEKTIDDYTWSELMALSFRKLLKKG